MIHLQSLTLKEQPLTIHLWCIINVRSQLELSLQRHMLPYLYFIAIINVIYSFIHSFIWSALSILCMVAMIRRKYNDVTEHLYSPSSRYLLRGTLCDGQY